MEKPSNKVEIMYGNEDLKQICIEILKKKFIQI